MSRASLLLLYKWKLLLCSFSVWFLLLQFHCPPPTAHILCTNHSKHSLFPEPSVQFLPFGAFACACLSFKNVTTPLSTHTTIPLWKNLLLFKAQIKCPEKLCDSFPVGTIIVPPIHKGYILKTPMDT